MINLEEMWIRTRDTYIDSFVLGELSRVESVTDKETSHLLARMVQPARVKESLVGPFLSKATEKVCVCSVWCGAISWSCSVPRPAPTPPPSPGPITSLVALSFPAFYFARLCVAYWPPHRQPSPLFMARAAGEIAE